MKTEWTAPGRGPVDGDLFPVEFEAGIAKVTTLADGGLRVYLDLGETDVAAAAKLMALRRRHVNVNITKGSG